MGRWTVKVQGEEQVLGLRVRDRSGRPIGRVVAVTWGADRFTMRWLTVRLPGLGRRLRSMPADQASWTSDGIRVPYSSAQVRHSPAVEPDDGSPLRDVVRYYDVLVPAAGVPA